MTSHITRGVYALPYLSETGGTMLVAVKGNGRKLAEREVAPGENPYSCMADLWTELRDDDPLPVAFALRQAV